MTDPGALRIRAAVNQELRHRVQHALRSAPDVATQPAHSAHPRRHALLGRTFRPTAKTSENRPADPKHTNPKPHRTRSRGKWSGSLRTLNAVSRSNPRSATSNPPSVRSRSEERRVGKEC